MRLITKRQLIDSTAARFRAVNQLRGEWLPATADFDPAAIYAKLAALPDGAPESDVIALTGDNRWTANVCDECHADVESTVLLAEEVSHHTDTVTLCPACLQAALKLLQA